jgi:hypothetical protein
MKLRHSIRMGRLTSCRLVVSRRRRRPNDVDMGKSTRTLSVVVTLTVSATASVPVTVVVAATLEEDAKESDASAFMANSLGRSESAA